MIEKLFKIKKKEPMESDLVDQGFSDLLTTFKEYKLSIAGTLVADLVFGSFFTGYLIESFLNLTGAKDKIDLIRCFYIPYKHLITALAALVLAFVLVAAEYKWFMMTRKPYYVDEDGNKVDKRGTLGDAHWQTEDERKVCFIRSKNILDTTENVLGLDKAGLLYSINPKLPSVNKNKAIFGTPGSGKSASVIENDIIQTIRRKESIIVTDSKGDLYRKTVGFAKENKYVVRMLNLKANELKNSDAFNLLKYLEGDSMVSTAEILARCILENTSDGKGSSYWEDNEMNLYKSLLLYVATNETLKAQGKNNLAEVYRIIATNTPDSLASIFSALPYEHPAKQSFLVFANAEPRNQGQILNGAGIRLGFFIDENAREIVSHDEIDLVLPMKRPCIYYVIIPDTNRAYNVIANLFFNMMLIKQCEYSDGLSDEDRKTKQIPVTYELDEFKATGSINNFDQTITTVRSRKLAFTIVLQAYGQLKDMYPGEANNVILGSMTLKLLLQAGDEDTAKYFTEMFGKQTRYVEGHREASRKTDVVKTRNETMTSASFQAVDLFPPNKAQQLGENDLVVGIVGRQPVKLKKYLSFNNPFLKDVKEVIPNQHIPKWRAIRDGIGKYKKNGSQAAQPEPDGSGKTEGENGGRKLRKKVQNGSPDTSGMPAPDDIPDGGGMPAPDDIPDIGAPPPEPKGKLRRIKDMKEE